MTRPYLTTSRLSEIAAQLDDGDRAVLDTLARVRVATGLQLQRLHHGKGDAAKQRRVRQLRRLSRWNLITTLNRRIGGPRGGSVSSVYVLDVGGLRLARPDERARTPWTPSTPFVTHALAVTELFVQLSTTCRGSIDLLTFTTEPTCWRTFVGRRSARVTVKPDAHAVIGVEEEELHWFIEVDLATEAATRIRAKATVYTDYLRTGVEQAAAGVFPKVLFVVPDTHRQAQLTAALPSGELFEVVTEVAAVNTLVGEVSA